MEKMWILKLASILLGAMGLHCALKAGLHFIHRFILPERARPLKAGNVQKEEIKDSLEPFLHPPHTTPFKFVQTQELEKIFLAPLRLLIWIIAASYAGIVLNQHVGPIGTRSENYFHVMRDCGIVAVLSWMALRWKRQKEMNWFKEGVVLHRMDLVTVSAIGKLITLLILALAGIWILQITGMNVLPLLAFGGISAATIGFAAKDVIANFFGGLMLHITRPFNLGEEILIEKEKIQGTVEEIGWCSTTIRDKEKRTVFLPNSSFAHFFVVNCSRRSHRRIYETYSIDARHADELNDLAGSIEQSLMSSPLVSSQELCLISLEHLRGDEIELSLDVYTPKTNTVEYAKARQEILLIVIGILKQRNIRLSASQGSSLRYLGNFLELAKFNKG